MKGLGLPPIKATPEQNKRFRSFFELSVLTAALLKGNINSEGFTKITESRLGIKIGENLSPKNRRL